MNILLFIFSLLTVDYGSITYEKSKLFLEYDHLPPSFGYSLLWEDEILYIGAIRATTPAATQTGAVYIFKKESGDWVQTTQIWSNNLVRSDFFGYDVSKTVNTMVIGAPQDREVANLSGAIYVFEKQLEDWVQTAKLKVKNPEVAGFFGSSVYINNERILAVGRSGIYEFKLSDGQWEETALLSSEAPENSYFFSFKAESDLIITADQSDSTNGEFSGAAYVFELIQNQWIETAKLYPSVIEERINFGYSSALSGDKFAIGAIRSGINGPESGSVYIFEKVNGHWIETSIIHPLAPEDHMFFGFSLHLDGSKLLVGAPGNATEEANSYVFEFNLIDAEWVQTAVYQGSDTDLQDRFGVKVNHQGGQVLVSAYQAYDQLKEAWNAYFFDSDYIFSSGYE